VGCYLTCPGPLQGTVRHFHQNLASARPRHCTSWWSEGD